MLEWKVLDKDNLPEKELLFGKPGSNSWLLGYVWKTDDGDMEAEGEGQRMEEPTHYFDPKTLRGKDEGEDNLAGQEEEDKLIEGARMGFLAGLLFMSDRDLSNTLEDAFSDREAGFSVGVMRKLVAASFGDRNHLYSEELDDDCRNSLLTHYLGLAQK